MAMPRKRKVLLTLSIFLGLLGVSLGLSVTSFLLLLNLDASHYSDYRLLSVLTYFSMVVFVVLLIVTIFVYLKNIDLFKVKDAEKGETNEEEKL